MQKYMVCWCCNHFIKTGDISSPSDTASDGYCSINEDILCWSEKRVCRKFTIRDGLHTKRILPEDLYY